ncbi:MAG: hypothetical protein KC489_10495, partial [Gemmatimonadetes bacterium]|nr:hypothetical protein [Gemmatimonadota bacterium]
MDFTLLDGRGLSCGTRRVQVQHDRERRDGGAPHRSESRVDHRMKLSRVARLSLVALVAPVLAAQAPLE